MNFEFGDLARSLAAAQAAVNFTFRRLSTNDQPPEFLFLFTRRANLYDQVVTIGVICWL
jgi:hypothetical protein